MNFRLELEPEALPGKIGLRDPVILWGSCFTEHMATRLKALKFSVLDNPQGILFNPISISKAVGRCISRQWVCEEDLFFHNEVWQSWDFHGRFSKENKLSCIQGMNESIEEAHRFMQGCRWAIITLGSAMVYRLKETDHRGLAGKVVANCHKVPANRFIHELCSYNELMEALDQMVFDLRSLQPSLRILFTISPVRHHREGLVMNNRSKGLLHLALHHFLQRVSHAWYFPAYELVIDDLRDYRFYAEDLVHPNHAATQYVWQKFVSSCIDDESKAVIKNLHELNVAMHHRPMHPETSQHKAFLQSMLAKTLALQEAHPYLDLEAECRYFSGS